MRKLTVAQYLLTRLVELGIHDIFGVPGDYNLVFLDQIVNFKSLRWVGNCNELNAAYAADGYARVKGMAAIVTTFGVGELSAINGIAGSYSEFLPVVHIVGAPATTTQKQGAIMHHTFGTGDFGVFIKMFEKISASVVILDTPETAGNLIDHALQTCWIKKQPIYISLPSDQVHVEIDAPSGPLILAYPASNSETLTECITAAVKLIRQAKSPVILADLCASRHHMKTLIQQLLDNTHLPFATMNMGKGIINESHPSFMGIYCGDYSSPGVQARIESSDCILSFGTLYSDFNTGGFSSKIDAKASIEIHSDHVKVHHAMYAGVYFNLSIPALTHALKGYSHSEKILQPSIPDYTPINQAITQERFWINMAHFFNPGDIIIAETGTSMFGTLATPIPDDATFIAQCLWGSIGYTVGAVLGAAMAAPTRRTLLFVGDGSFQLTAQELSTVIRHKLTPIVFLLNNDGYTIERAIHGANMTYNDIQPWNYAALPAIFGKNVFSVRVHNEQELAAALTQTATHRDNMCFIEVMMDKTDCPENLRLLGQMCDKKNKGN